MGLSDCAKFDAEGNEALQGPEFPFELILEPNAQLRKRFDSISVDPKYPDLNSQLATLPPQQHLYTMYARSAPGAQPEEIGELVSSSTFTQSTFGDEKLFFKHQKMEEDIALRPEWETLMAE